MIKLTRLNNEIFYLNCDNIETIEEVPHTIIRTLEENSYIVAETAEEIIDRIIAFKRQTFQLPEYLKKGN